MSYAATALLNVAMTTEFCNVYRTR